MEATHLLLAAQLHQAVAIILSFTNGEPMVLLLDQQILQLTHLRLVSQLLQLIHVGHMMELVIHLSLNQQVAGW
jgi:hypothetical protein